MDHPRAVLWLLVILAITAPSVLGQNALPRFDVDVVGVMGDDAAETRVDLYTRIPLSDIQFIRASGGFRASYQVTADFFTVRENGRRGNRVVSEVWDRPVFVEQFAATQSENHFDALTQSVPLAPGQYLLQVQVEDRSSGRATLQELRFEVRDLDKPLAVSDLILIESYDASRNTISPRVSNRISTDPGAFRFFYELYAGDAAEVRITTEVIRLQKSGSSPSIRTLFGLDQDDDLLGEVAYQRPETTRLRKGRQAVVSEVPVSELGAGDYLLRVSVEDANGRVLDRAQKVISALWTGLAEHIQNLDDAIAQLQYIAKDRDVRFIRDGQDERERLERFRDFWKKRDPTPNTERNENMEEYYYRISYANRKYGSLIAGWKTDRGNVMVRFGEPDHVERRPFNFDVEPYEVWYYYRLGKRFIFIDKTGMGDYRLWVPIWDERNTIR